MKVSSHFICVFLLTLALSVPNALAQDESSPMHLIVSRDSGGEIRKESKEAIQVLSNMAKENGHVHLWLTLAMPFDPFLADVSEQAAASQAATVDSVFGEILTPLLLSDQVQYIDGNLISRGPSVMLMATKKGLSELVKDERIAQIVGVRSPVPN